MAQTLLDPLPSPLPIIAPPPYILIPRAPSSAEEVAEGRIAMMLSKEQTERLEDSLPLLRDLQHPVGPDTKNRKFSGNMESGCEDSDESETDQEVERTDDDCSMEGDSADESENEDENEPPISRVNADENGTRDWDDHIRNVICIEEDFRQEVVEWVLNVSYVLSISSLDSIETSLSFILPLKRSRNARISRNNFRRTRIRDGMPLSFFLGTSFVSDHHILL